MLKEMKEIINSIGKINKALEDKTINKIFKKSIFSEKDLAYLQHLCNELLSSFSEMNDDEQELLLHNYQFAEINLYLKHFINYAKNYRKSPTKELHDMIIRNFDLIKKKVDYLKSEYEDKVLEKMNAIDRELLVLLTKYSVLRYQVYKKYFATDLKSYVDQFHRDNRLTGFPDDIINSILQIIKENKYDYLVCVLRAGLTYTLLFELLGFSRHRIKYIVSGRIHGKHAKSEKDLSFTPISDSLKFITGKSVLVVDNNLFNGNTAKRVCLELNKHYMPEKISLFLDYICARSPLEDNLKFKEKFDNLLHEVYISKNKKIVLKKAQIKDIKLELIYKLRALLS